jgi:hypothetical protein
MDDCYKQYQSFLYGIGKHNVFGFETSSVFAEKGGVMSRIRFVPTGIHAYFDYVGGIGLISAPFLFGFANIGGVAVFLPIILGVGLILYSLLTDYELGIPGLKFIPMTFHLIFDFVAAALIAASPFLFGFSQYAPNVWLPHLISGIVVILLVLVSQVRSPAARKSIAA